MVGLFDISTLKILADNQKNVSKSPFIFTWGLSKDEVLHVTKLKSHAPKRRTP